MDLHGSKRMLLWLGIAFFYLAVPLTSIASDAIYWNNPSFDGPGMNVGYCMTSQGGCAGLVAGAPGAVPYWGLPSGGADPNFYLTSSGPITFTLQLVEATNTPYDTFGWYAPAPGTTSGVLLQGTQATGSTATLPAGSYGFYLTDSAAGGGTWYSQASLNSSGEQSDQHFVVFDATSTSFWIGMEDLSFEPAGNSDKDYQDLLVQVTITPGYSGPLGIAGTTGAGWQPWTSLPEPATVSLLVIGLVGVAFKRRKSVR